MSSLIRAVRTEILADAANPQLLVHLEDDDGASGTGETWWGTYQPAAPPGAPVRPIASFVDHVLVPLCVGRSLDSVDDVRTLWHRLRRATYQYGPDGIVSSAIAGVDLAAWDLLGRRLGRPVAELLGPPGSHELRAYASLHWLGDATRARTDARNAVDRGFRAVKLHEIDARVVLAVREEVGPDVALMVDLSARLDERATLELADRLADARIEWLEEPVFPQQDHAALARLRRRIPIPIAAGENEFGAEGFARLLASGAVDVVQPDLVKCGGLSPAADIARLATDHGVALAPHNYSLGPSLRANVHWASSAPATQWVEVPWLPAGQRFPSGERVPTLAGGCIPRPTGPGLAVD